MTDKTRELRTTIEIALYKHKMKKRLKENAQWLITVLNSIGDGGLILATENFWSLRLEIL